MVKITQEGVDELCLMFDEKNLKQLETLFKIRKRYKFSKKELLNRVERLKKARQARENGKKILVEVRK